MKWHKIDPGKPVLVNTDLYLCLDDYTVRVGYFRKNDGQGFCYCGNTGTHRVIYWARMKYPPKHFYHKVKRRFLKMVIYIFDKKMKKFRKREAVT